MSRLKKEMRDIATRATIGFMMGMVAMAVSPRINAEDDVYKRGQDQSFIADCANPTTRTDGSNLPLSEIDRVEYFIDDSVPVDYASLGNPLYTLIMDGGCAPSSVDLQQFPTRTTLYKFGFTIDTDGNTSPVSISRSMVVNTANPNAPGQIK